jgi:hypothetical protein
VIIMDDDDVIHDNMIIIKIVSVYVKVSNFT